jgi:hypothetical protein
MSAPELKTKTPGNGVYERLGVWYFHRLVQDVPALADAAADDAALARHVRRITAIGMVVSFVIGAISAAGSAYVEVRYAHASAWVKYGWLVGVTAFLTAIELAVLFWISLRTVYHLSAVTGHRKLEEKDPAVRAMLPALLARAALEIPDPVEKLLGIDPLARVSRSRQLIYTILYKLKIVTSNVLAKLLVGRFFGKSLLRVSVAYIAVPITGLWNALTLLKVAREARLRLFGNVLVAHLIDEVLTPERLGTLSPRARLGCLQAVGNAVVIAQRAHPNMALLLRSLHGRLDLTTPDVPLDDWDAFLMTLGSVKPAERDLLRGLLVVAAAFDGEISRLEREMLGQAFGERGEHDVTEMHALVADLRQGRLHAARARCDALLGG